MGGVRVDELEVEERVGLEEVGGRERCGPQGVDRRREEQE